MAIVIWPPYEVTFMSKCSPILGLDLFPLTWLTASNEEVMIPLVFHDALVYMVTLFYVHHQLYLQKQKHYLLKPLDIDKCSSPEFFSVTHDQINRYRWKRKIENERNNKSCQEEVLLQSPSITLHWHGVKKVNTYSPKNLMNCIVTKIIHQFNRKNLVMEDDGTLLL